MNDYERLQELFLDYQSLPEYFGIPLNDVNTKSLFGDYPIHVAIVRGALEDVELLLRNGANLNAHGDDGYTPLHSAVERGALEIIQLLLAHGADVSARNMFGQSPLELADVLDMNEAQKILRGSERAR